MRCSRAAGWVSPPHRRHRFNKFRTRPDACQVGTFLSVLRCPLAMSASPPACDSARSDTRGNVGVNAPLVLSLFPGIGLLDMAFEQEGFCVVRGPDVLWGGDIRRFHPPAGVFQGVIGGPPCQAFSRLAIMVRHNGYEPKFGNLIPEFERCAGEAWPQWWLMENVPAAPVPFVQGYTAVNQVVNNRWFSDGALGAEQNRERRLTFGSGDGRALIFDVALFEHPGFATGVTSSDGGGVMRGRHAVLGDQRQVPVRFAPYRNGEMKEKPFAVTARMCRKGNLRDRVAGTDSAGHGGENSKQYVYSLEDACELQGLPRDFTEHMPFRKEAKLKAVANGVPLPMGRAIARAVKRAMTHAS
jgi:DNA (cytosine-5)-methyltransferase 1